MCCGQLRHSAARRAVAPICQVTCKVSLYPKSIPMFGRPSSRTRRLLTSAPDILKLPNQIVHFRNLSIDAIEGETNAWQTELWAPITDLEQSLQISRATPGASFKTLLSQEQIKPSSPNLTFDGTLAFPVQVAIYDQHVSMTQRLRDLPQPSPGRHTSEVRSTEAGQEFRKSGAISSGAHHA
jgi:hypothetical protein